jgi:hypothetical protein
VKNRPRSSLVIEPPPAWTGAPPSAPADVDADVALLREAFPLAELPRDHPVRTLWGRATERARFALHHLADDLRVVEAVPGAQSLLKLLRSDRDGFEDFRYELRVAAAVGRSPDQELLRLGGPAAGPDVEFISRSGHRCGIACYRARSATPAVDIIRKALTAVARSFNRRFTFYPVAGDMLIEVVFPIVPLRKTDEATACNLLYDFWLRHDVGVLERDGLKVQRLVLADLPRFPGERRRARVRFLLPMGKAERTRVLGHVGSKLPKEVASWAGSYTGVPVFAIEQSDSIHSGRLRGDVDVIMLDESHAFGGILMTYYPSAQGIESVDWVPRKGASLGLDIEIKTFGANTKVWSDGRPVVSITPEHAREEWEFVQSARGTSSAIVTSLSAGSHHVRLPPLRDPSRRPSEDPDFEHNLRDAFERIQLEEGKLVVCNDPAVAALHAGHDVRPP